MAKEKVDDYNSFNQDLEQLYSYNPKKHRWKVEINSLNID